MIVTIRNAAPILFRDGAYRRARKMHRSFDFVGRIRSDSAQDDKDKSDVS